MINSMSSLGCCGHYTYGILLYHVTQMPFFHILSNNSRSNSINKKISIMGKTISNKRIRKILWQTEKWHWKTTLESWFAVGVRQIVNDFCYQPIWSYSGVYTYGFFAKSLSSIAILTYIGSMYWLIWLKISKNRVKISQKTLCKRRSMVTLLNASEARHMVDIAQTTKSPPQVQFLAGFRQCLVDWRVNRKQCNLHRRHSCEVVKVKWPPTIFMTQKKVIKVLCVSQNHN